MNKDIMELYGTIYKLPETDVNYRTYYLKNETGTGAITVYQILDGIKVVYNHMHMAYCNQNQKASDGVIEINHCREGRYECNVGNQTCCYMTSGDFSIGSLKRNITKACFPLNYYHGITIFIEKEKISEDLKNIMKLLNIDVGHVVNLAEKAKRYCIIRENKSIEHIFSELYSICEDRKESYLKVKILELLLFLSDLDMEEYSKDVEYLNQNQVRMAKEVERLITSNICRHFTIEELANRFRISKTAMKNNFKSVYGISIYAYLRTYRLQTAEKLLLNTENSVAEIAHVVGYENPNKFTSAFKKEYNVTPTEFRKSVRLDRN